MSHAKGGAAHSRRGVVWVAGLTLMLSACAVTPEPVTHAELTEHAKADRTFLASWPLTGPLTLDEARRRALSYNLDMRVRVMEEALAQDQLDLSRWDMLPKVTAQAGYTSRSNEAGSSSQSVATGQQSLEASTSQERTRRVADLSMTWNALDFGVGYFSARQNADRALIAAERRRKTAHLLVQDVESAYWRAVSAQALTESILRTMTEAEAALDDSRRVEAESLRSPLDSLRYQRGLLEILRQLDALRLELSTAKAQLAMLVGLAPGKPFELAQPDEATMTVTLPSADFEQLEETALLQNPDLREHIYNRRISAAESRKALLKLLPGISLTVSRNYDSNKYLVHNAWNERGLAVAWNLMNLFTAQSSLKLAESGETIAEARRQAAAMAILTQLHVAHTQATMAAHQFERADALDKVESRISIHLTNRAAADALGRLEQVSGESSAIVARLRRFLAYAEYRGALGRLKATLGDEILPEAAAADPEPKV
ncbi:MAG: TolC family protein [Rhodospirillaceae bacterium]|nr:TolC family protein [Rhodospirillales bacterium]